MELWVLVALGVVLLGGYVWYAKIIGKRNRAQEALASIDVQLRKRHDLVPNLLKIARRFMEHEKDLLEEITRVRARAVELEGARDAAAAAEKFAVEEQLAAGLGKLMVQMEAYPELRSVEPMTQAQQSFAEVEGNIAAARRFYNSAVTDLRNAIQIFPGNLIAGLVGVREMPFYEAEEIARQPVDADAYL
ncbi:MAG: LemA family protein [Acidobacteriota bacterium]